MKRPPPAPGPAPVLDAPPAASPAREIDRFNRVQPRPAVQPHQVAAPAPTYLGLGVLGARVVR